METVRGTQLLERAFKIIDILSLFPKGLTLSEISERTNLPISTTHRIIHFFMQSEYIRVLEPGGLYSIGSKFAVLSSIYMKGFDFIKEIRPALEKLNRKFDETVHLGVLNNSRNMVVYVDKLESSRTVRMFSMVGQTVPIHCTALGKSLVSSLPASKVEKLLENYSFKKYTENTITTKSAFLEELEKVKEKGFAVDNREHEDTVICYGKAFSDDKGHVMAAVSISMPSHRFQESSETSLVESLNTTIHWIESRIV